MPPDDKPNVPMTPREYVETIVLPTLREALDARDDRRRAYLACLVVCHVADSLGLAEAAREPGFAASSGRGRRDAVEAATKIVQAAVSARCGPAFSVVQGIANGTKHPARLPLLPGTERAIPAFDWDTHTGEAGEETRWEAPGLQITLGDRQAYLDVCVQRVLATFVLAYPTHLSGIALSSFMDPGLPVLGVDMVTAWLEGIAAWAAGRSEVAEVWLFGSRAKGTARPDSDVDLGLVLVPGEPGHDWPLGNALSTDARWREALEDIVGRHVSLELFSRPGEAQGEDEAAARLPAILLWKRDAERSAEPER